MAHGRVRALLFDVFGTLVDWRTSVATQLEAFGRERGMVTVYAEALIGVPER